MEIPIKKVNIYVCPFYSIATMIHSAALFPNDASKGGCGKDF